VVAGVLWWSQSGPPAAPFVATVTVADVDGAVVLDDLDALAVTAGGPVVVNAHLYGAIAGTLCGGFFLCNTIRRVPV